MNLLQRSIRNEASGATGSSQTSGLGGSIGSKSRMGGLSGGGFTSSGPGGYFGFSSIAGGTVGGGAGVMSELTSSGTVLTTGGLAVNNSVHTGQTPLHATLSDPTQLCNYGKLFPPQSLRYLHEHNHLHDFPPELLPLQSTSSAAQQTKNAAAVAAATVGYTGRSGKQRSNSGNKLVFRISLLDTDVYQPQDVPTSPQHLPHPRGELPSPAHAEWVRRTVQRLRTQFPPPHSLLLVNVEKRAKYPFVLFGSPGPRFSAAAGPIMPTASTSVLSHELRITDGLYEECDSIRLNEDETRTGGGGCSSQPLGYIISAYQTFPGEDSEKLEESWFVWTGGSHLSRYLPSDIGLRRFVFYKRRDLHLLKSNCLKQFVDNEMPIFTYVLFAELYQLQQRHLPAACAVIDQLRARCCGYTALYINCT